MGSQSKDGLSGMVMSDDYCTAWELFKQYGISKVKTSRAIRSGKLSGFMNTTTDEQERQWTVLKWYIVKNEALADFIAKERKQ